MRNSWICDAPARWQHERAARAVSGCARVSRAGLFELVQMKPVCQSARTADSGRMSAEILEKKKTLDLRKKHIG